jgi:TRAP-type C4-dicarboxylate transport system permease small subunit
MGREKMKIYRKFLDFTNKFETAILMISTLAFTVIIFSNVITRYFFNYSWAPMEEVVRFIRVLVAFLGASYATRKGLHINMSVFYEWAPQRIKKVFVIVISAVSCTVSVLLTYYGFQMAFKSLEGQQTSPALRFPLGYIYMALPLGCLLMTIHFARNLMKNIMQKQIYLGPDEEGKVQEP